MGAVSPALKALEEARELSPTEADAYLLEALLLRELERLDEATEVLEEGLARGADQPELIEELCFLLLTKGQRDRARELAEQALGKHPNRGNLKLALGLVLAVHPEEQQKAAVVLAEALDLGSAKPGRVHMELGQVLLELGKTDEAVKNLHEAARLLPDSPEAHYRLGNALRTAGDVEGAKVELQRFQSLLREKDKKEWELKELGTVLNDAQKLAMENRLHESLLRLDTYLKARPQDSKAHALRAKVLSSLGRNADALESIVRARELAPQMVEYHYLEGHLLAKTGQAGAAEICLRRTLTLDPEVPQAHELLGVIAADDGCYEKAVEHFQKTLGLGVDSATLRLNLAEALRKLGRHEESDEQMKAYHRLSQKQ
jgi:tetratricopeptide (TPR) repeat protein